MRNPSLYRVCGNALVVAAVLFAAALFLIRAPNGIGLDAVRAAFTPRSSFGYVLEALGLALSLAGVLALARHFAGAPGEGWATLALGVYALGAAALFIVFACSALANRTVATLAAAPGAPLPALGGAAAAVYVVRRAAWVAGASAVWISLVPFGVAMLGGPGFKRYLAWTTVAIGVVEFAAIFLLRVQPVVYQAVLFLGVIYLALLGVSLARLGRAVPAAAPQPGVLAH